MSSSFGLSDWAVVALIFALTSWIGKRMSGTQATFRDFFLGGRRLPWYAVAGSIVATEISAVTLISLPATVFKAGGNLEYLQLGIIGSLVARCLVALIMVPAFYEREIYSPYDFVGARLGEGVRRTTTILFSIGGVLGQASRVYLTGLVLEVILHAELARWSEFIGQTGIELSGIELSILLIGVVSVGWTWMGGIATVIWTDVVLFVVFLAAAAIAIWVLCAEVHGGAGGVLQVASEAGKLRFLDFGPREASGRLAKILADDYTFWAALIAQGLGGLGSYGSDQLMAQRIFCCKDKRDAQKAMLASYGAMLVTACVGFIGLALFAYYREHPLQGAALASYQESSDRIFPIFITTVIHSPLKGLIVAGALAAAISSLDAILAALSQTTMSAFYRPVPMADRAAGERRAVFVSRALVLVFGVLLCTIAAQCQRLVEHYGSILNLALAMPAYTQGAVLGAFVLAFLPLRLCGDGYPWAAALSVSTIFALAWRNELARELQSAAATSLFASWIALRMLRGRKLGSRPEWGRTLLFATGLAPTLWLADCTWLGPISWVWYVLLGTLIAVAFGWLLDSRSEIQGRTS